MNNVNVYSSGNITSVTQNINQIISVSPIHSELEIIRSTEGLSVEVQQDVTELTVQRDLTASNIFGLTDVIDERFEILVENSGIPSSSVIGLNQAIDDRVPPKSKAKAWITFDSTTTPITIRNSYNILSVTDNGVGDFTINFLQPFQNSNYCYTTWSRDRNTDNFIYGLLVARSNSIKTPSSIRLINNLFTNGVNYDSPECNAIFFGD